MKVGILTINDDINLGNRLQNYATQEVLKKLGIAAHTIRNTTAKYIIKKDKKHITRRNLFAKFNEDYINFSDIVIDKYNIPNDLSSKYDFFITGSDQVWNPYFDDRTSDIDFLTFAEEKQRIAFTASFGVENIPNKLKEYYIEKLTSFNHISVREYAGAKIVEELTEKNAEVLIDPTMMLTYDEWSKIAKRPEKLKDGKYILNYFIGGLSDIRRKEINKIAKENNCKVINIFEEDDDFFSSGPCEFLYLIKNSFLICTDSFHSSAFSLLFNRPFVIYNREDSINQGERSMKSRIDTLFETFKLHNRVHNGIIDENLLNHEYKESFEILEKERIKSINFLKKAFEMEC